MQAILDEAIIEKGSIEAARSNYARSPAGNGAWSGGVWLDNSMAYAPQVPYIRHGTIRDNVLFGQPFWAERYYEVIRQSGLEPDLRSLEDGDMTEIGEGGVNLVSPVLQSMGLQLR